MNAYTIICASPENFPWPKYVEQHDAHVGRYKLEMMHKRNEAAFAELMAAVKNGEYSK